MTWRSPIFSNGILLWIAWHILAGATPGATPGATLSGRVELTGTKTKDLSGVVVWLEPLGDVPETPLAGQHAVMTQKDKMFLPHILAVQTGTTVDFPNLDPIFHNAFSSFDGKVFDVGLYPPGTSRSVRFDREGVVRVFCNIHPAMSAVIVVVKHPWFAKSLRDGSFRIEAVPEGEYKLRVYHERATEANLAQLTRMVSVKEDRTELKTIVISEAGYLPAPHKNKYGKDYPHTTVYSEHMQ